MPEPEERIMTPEVSHVFRHSTVSILKENSGLLTKQNSQHPNNNNISSKETKSTSNNENDDVISKVVQRQNSTKTSEKGTAVKNKSRIPITRSQSEKIPSKNSGRASTQGRKSKDLLKGASVGANLGRQAPSRNKNKVVLVSELPKSNHSNNTNGSTKPNVRKTVKDEENSVDKECSPINLPQNTRGKGGIVVTPIDKQSYQRDWDQDPKGAGTGTMADGNTSGEEYADTSWDHEILKYHDKLDDLELEDDLAAVLSGEKCFFCFCCFTEIWSSVMSMLFQDLPFLITRLFIMFHYKVVSHMTVFFTFKNIVTILLLLNRIRVVVLEEYRPWKKEMTDTMRVKKRNAEILREKRRRRIAKGQRDGVVEGYDGTDQDCKTEDRDYVVENTEKIEHANGNTGDTTSGQNSKKAFKKRKWLFWRV